MDLAVAMKNKAIFQFLFKQYVKDSTHFLWGLPKNALAKKAL